MIGHLKAREDENRRDAGVVHTVGLPLSHPWQAVPKRLEVRSCQHARRLMVHERHAILRSLELLEREHIARIVAHSSSLETAARTLDIDATTLQRKRKRYGLV
jgi:transcriptional regulator with GAF, ATPase, and Fis domain